MEIIAITDILSLCGAILWVAYAIEREPQMSRLQDTIEHLATTFVNSVVEAIRNAPLAELAASGAATATVTAKPGVAAASRAKGPSTRPAAAAGPVASAARPRGGAVGVDIEKYLSKLLGLLGTTWNGAQGGELRNELGLSKGQFLRVAAAGMHMGKIRREGERRGIHYFLA